jgi:WD40 repeat protein
MEAAEDTIESFVTLHGIATWKPRILLTTSSSHPCAGRFGRSSKAGENMKYKAFISYSRVDSKVAESIHTALDRYSVPRQVAGTPGVHGIVPPKLHPIFMDRTDLAVGGTVANRLKDALEGSEALVVLCSPAAIESLWVDREIAAFIELGRSDRIFPVIVPGVPDTDDVEAAYFPASLRGRGILAADLRDLRLPNGKIVGDGRDGGRMKLIAGLLGVDLDQLRRRELQRAQAAAVRNGAFALGAIILFALAAIGGVAAFSAAITAEDRANAAQIAESSFISDRALERLSSGYGAAALADARRALPQSFDTPDRPFLLNSQDALRAALLQNREIARFTHPKPVGAAIFLADGQTVLTSEIGGRVRSWDRATGETLQEWTAFETGDPVALIALGSDSAAVSDAAGQIEIITSGSKDTRALSPGTSRPRRLLAAGESLMAICEDGTVHAWQWRDGQGHSMISNTDAVRNAIALSTDGETAAYVVSTPEDGFEVVVAAPGSLQEPIFSMSTEQVFSLALSFDGKQVAYGTGFDVVVADITSGNSKVLTGHNAFVLDIMFSEDGERLVTSGADGLAKVWHIRTEGSEADLVGHEGLVPSIVFAADGRFAATLGRDRTIRIWPFDGSPRPVPVILRGHEGAIRSLALSNDEAYLLTASDDATVRVWQVRNPSLRRIAESPVKLTPLAWSQTLDLVIGLDPQNQLVEVNLASPEDAPRSLADLSSASGDFSALAAGSVAPEGLGAFQVNERTFAWRPGLAKPADLALPDRRIVQMQSATRNDTIAFLAEDRSLWLHRQGAVAQIRSVPVGHLVAISSGGDLLAVGRQDGVALVDTEQDALIGVVSDMDPEGVEFSPDGTVGIAFSNRASVLFDAYSAKILMEIEQPAVMASVSSGGEVVAGVSGTGAVWTWTKQHGLHLATVEIRQPAPRSIAFSPEHTLAAIAHADGVIRIWKTESSILVGQIDTEGRGAISLLFAGPRTIVGLSDWGDRLEWHLPPVCEELLLSGDKALAVLQGEFRDGPNPDARDRTSIYLQYVRPLVLPFVAQAGDQCGSSLE